MNECLDYYFVASQHIKNEKEDKPKKYVNNRLYTTTQPHGKGLPKCGVLVHTDAMHDTVVKVMNVDPEI